METLSTVFKALDVLTIVTAHEDGMSLPDLALALNQPRSNIVRLVRTLQQYGFVSCHGRQWVATGSFRAWSASTDRHGGFRRRYRPALEHIAAVAAELVTLGLHEGNGIIHLDAIEAPDHACRAPLPDIRHSLRGTAMGRLALSRRSDLASKLGDPALERDLADIRRAGHASHRGESGREVVTLALPGFSNLPTEPMIAITWPLARYSDASAARARLVALEALRRAALPPAESDWTLGSSSPDLQVLSVV